MIRNVVMGRLRASSPADVEQLDAAIAGIAALDLPGLVSMQVGRDLGLRDGGWDFAITNVWTDAEAYRNYDADPAHNVYRARIVEVCEQVARVQIEIAQV